MGGDESASDESNKFEKSDISLPLDGEGLPAFGGAGADQGAWWGRRT